MTLHVLVCKNDGAFEFEQLKLAALESWGDVKLQMAKCLYSEEELFAVASPSEITLYKLPEGDDIEVRAQGEPLETHISNDTRWVLDIFSGPFRHMSDLTLQTDALIRNMRRHSSGVTNRTSSRSSPRNMGGYPPCSLPIEYLLSDASLKGSPYYDPYIHIGTWVPVLVKDKDLASTSFMNVLKPSSSEYEDVLMTTNRAKEYINRFRRIGKPVTLISIQTVTLPIAVACPSAISTHGSRILYEGVYQLTEKDAQRGFVQAVRIWFSFDCEQTISVTKVQGTLGLKPLRQQDGWIVVQALPGSPCFEAGMRAEELFLTHVNGVDVSPHAFPSVATKYADRVSWKDSVIPLVEKSETCIFTFF